MHGLKDSPVATLEKEEICDHLVSVAESSNLRREM